MSKGIVRMIGVCLVLILLFGSVGQLTPVQANPGIDVWYGLTQNFGGSGNPQGQIAILGNVSDAASPISTLTFTLNGSASRALSMGPDTRRLLKAGDFAVELFDSELLEGSNTVVITATNAAAETQSVPVTVNYSRSNRWSLPYTVNTWTNANDQAQVVDGKWKIESGKLITEEFGYDRLVALGDMSWENYEVQAEFTPISIDPNCVIGSEYDCGDPSYEPAVGVIARWTGHTDLPSIAAGRQPKSGWQPLGAIGWYRWDNSPSKTGSRAISGNSGSADGGNSPLTLGTTYTLKFRVETVDGLPVYNLKIWSGVIEPGWQVTWQGSASDPRSGSVVLFAHHVETSFGSVSVTPLGASPQAVNIVSDDFNTCSLDTNRWNFYTPVNQGIAAATVLGGYSENAALNISIPGSLSADHNPDVNQNNAARVRQTITTDGDFAVEAKFASQFTASIQMQGIMVEGTDPNNFMRLEFFSSNSGDLHLYARYFSGLSGIPPLENEVVYTNQNLGSYEGISPLYLKLERTGVEWRLLYKVGGAANWTVGARFPQPFNAQYIGVYAGNAIKPYAPAHTAVVDYFLNVNTGFPVAEDSALNSLTVNTVGSGSVARSVTSSNYACGTSVDLTANPTAEWFFSNWSGALTGSINPSAIVMNGPKTVTATFTNQPVPVYEYIFLPFVLR